MRGIPRGLDEKARIDGINKYTELLFAEIDYNLIFIFIGLFIVSGAFVDTLYPKYLWTLVAGTSAFSSTKSTILISIYTIIASQLVGNVSLVIMVSNEMSGLSHDRQRFGWLVISYVSTIAGNFTLVGSAANIIVCERAQRHRTAPVQISALEHFMECGAITLISIVIGVSILYAESKSMDFIQ